MAHRQWPSVSSDHPNSILDHSRHLRDEFAAIGDFARENQSNQIISATLPHELKSKILSGVSDGIQEAMSNGALQSNTSDARQVLLQKTIYRNIKMGAAPVARDRVPVCVFVELLDSYEELLVKLRAHPALCPRTEECTPAPVPSYQPERSDAENSRAVLRDVPSASTKAMCSGCGNDLLIIAEPFAMKEKETAALAQEDITVQQSVQAIVGEAKVSTDEQEHRNARTEAEEVDIQESRETGSAEEQSDGEHGEEDSGEEQSDSEGETSSEDDLEKEGEHPNNSTLPTEGTKHEHNDMGSDAQNTPQFESSDVLIKQKGAATEHMNTITNSEHQNSPKTLNTCLPEGRPQLKENPTGACSGYSISVMLCITPQITVNLLQAMQYQEMMKKLSSSFRRLLPKHQDIPRDLKITEAENLQSGNVRVGLRSAKPTLPTSQGWIDAWGRDFTNDLTSPPRLYKVRTAPLQTVTMNLRSRKEKAVTIDELAAANVQRLPSLVRPNGIIDINWYHQAPANGFTALIVSFSSPRQANEALRNGLKWHGQQYTCEVLKPGPAIRRCDRCQTYGHYSFNGCAAPFKCGKCAGYHQTKACTSSILKCANCGGAHEAKVRSCPVKKSERAKERVIEFYEPQEASLLVSFPQKLDSRMEPQTTIITNSSDSTSSSCTDTETNTSDTDVEGDEIDSATEQCNDIQEKLDLLPGCQRPESKTKPKGLPGEQDAANPLDAIETLRQEVDDLRAEMRLFKDQGQTSRKRSSDEAFSDVGLSHLARDSKRARAGETVVVQ